MNKNIRVKCFLVIAIFLSIATAFWMYMMYISWLRQNGTFVHYEEALYSSNDTYHGMIDIAEERVHIWNQSLSEVSGVDLQESYPDQIVLADTTYFLLYRQYDRNNDALIVQYDYQSVKKQEYRAQNVTAIYYKDGYLFMGSLQGDLDGKYGFSFSSYSFYANYYIKEQDFGKKSKQLKRDKDGNCIIGGTKWYSHDDGCFAMEPLLEDYPGVSEDTFEISDNNYQAETKQELANRRLLLSEIGRISDCVYQVFEYQSGNKIYGLCNIYKKGKYISSLPHESNDIKSVYFYEIDPNRNEITVLLEKRSCMGIILSNHEAVYQECNKILHYDFQTESEKMIYQLQNEHYVMLYAGKEGLMVMEEKKRAFLSVFSTDKAINSVIKWQTSSVSEK